MRSVEFNVTPTEITPNTAEIGNAGEHNVTLIKFNVSNEILDSVDYFRVSAGNYRSEKIYAEESVVSYLLPQWVLESGTVLLQLDGYKAEDGEIFRIFKSDIVTAEVGTSVCVGTEIPSELEEPYENAVAELEALIDEGIKITEAVSQNSKLAETSAESAATSAGAAADSATDAKSSADSARDSAESAADSSASADSNASMTREAVRLAEDYAATAEKSELSASESAANADVACENAKAYATSAASYATQAIDSAESAESSAASAAESAGRLAILRDEELIVYHREYKNEAPEWEDTDDVHFKKIGLKCLFEEDKAYLCRVWFEGNNPTAFYLSDVILTAMGSGLGTEGIATALLNFDEGLDCYLVEFTPTITISEDEGANLFVSLPYNNMGHSNYSASFGGIEIFSKDNLRNVVGKQSEKIGNIEAALDGIIAMQENLIGGETS